MSMKRVLAIIGIVVWGALIIATVISAFFASAQGGRAIFSILLILTIFLPIILYIFLMMVKSSKKGLTASQVKKYNKRLKKGEAPEKIADEIEAEYKKDNKNF